MGQVAKNTDPAADRKAAMDDAKVEALQERMTLARLLDDWKRLHLSTRRPRYQAEAVGTLERVFKDWLPRPAERLARKDCAAPPCHCPHRAAHWRDMRRTP